MRTTAMLSIMALAFLVAPALSAQDEAEAKSEGIAWTADYEAAKKTAKAENKRLFIEFTAEWWGPCKRLARDVWPDEKLAEVVAKDFVPVMLYDDKAPEILKQYEVRAFPTFIVTDAEGTEEMRQVGAPFSTPEDAIEWFPGIIDALDNLPEYEKAHKAKPEDLDAALKLAEAYNTLGRGEDSLKIYTAVAPKIEEEDERYVDVQLAYADALMGTMSRDNEAEVGGKIGEIYDSLLPDLIEAKDERAVDPGVLNARIKAFLDDDFEGAREQIHALTAAFAEHDRATEMKFFAAYFAQMDEDFDTAKAEYQAIIDAGEADDNWVKNAKKQLEAIEMDAEEKKDTEE